LSAKTQAISFDAAATGPHIFTVSFVDTGGVARTATATINVTATADAIASDGRCSLREAVYAARFDQPVDGTVGNAGAALEFAAERFVVAAGALHSPALLLRSGLAEASPGGRWIGRRLMRHCSAVIAGFFPGRTNPEGVFHKQLCVSDFYEDLRGELGTATGTIQDVYTPAAVVVRQRAPAGLGTFAAWLSSRMQNLLSIAEDDPRPENAVSLTAERDRYGLEIARIDHEYTAADYRRRDYLAGHARRVLKAAGAWATRIHAIDTFSHGVGSVGMAESPEAGALDPECRVWGLSNLWGTD